MEKYEYYGYPLTRQQRRVWALQKALQVPFNYVLTIRLRGPLAHDRLTRALAAYVHDNEAFNLRLKSYNNLLCPLQHPVEPVQYSYREAEATGPGDLESCIETEKSRWFDCEAGEVVRFTLLRTGAGEHHLVVASPALLSDADTLKECYHYLVRAYEHPPQDDSGAPQGLGYIDYAEWQKDLLAAEESREAARYWDGTFSGDTLAVDLPFALPGNGPANITSVPLPAGTCAAAGGPGRLIAGVPSSVYLLTCWYVLLGRFTSGPFTIGYRSNGRTQEELAHVAGLFEKELPLRLPPVDQAGAGQVLAAAGEALADQRQWQEYFCLEPYGNGGALQYFPYAFAYDSLPAAKQAGGLSFSVRGITGQTAPGKLRLSCVWHEEDQTLEAHLAYDARYFTREAAQALGCAYDTLVKSLAGPAGTPLAAVGRAGAVEAAHLLGTFNPAPGAFPAGTTVVQCFAEQVAKTPDAVAVAFESQPVTYRQLNREANRIAHALRQHCNVGAGDLVGLLSEKSAYTVAAILGVLKAGAAYIPIDPEYPAERISFILQDASPKAVLVDAGSAGRKLPAAHPPVLPLDGPSLAAYEDTDPATAPAPEDLAYLIYTSGSTGQPKGVMVEHRNLLNHLYGIRTKHHLEPGWNYLLLSSISFDASLKQMFLPLLSGAKVCITRNVHNHVHLIEYLAQQEVHVINGTPSLVKALVAEAARPAATGALAGVRCVLVGGEKLSRDLCRQIGQVFPGSMLVNLYGPTETCVNAASYAVAAAPGPVPIGTPLPNYRLYVLDESRQLLSLGVAGEICIAGAGVARGYLHRETLNAEKFVPDPFGPGKLYRTGDLGRWLPDGNLEFLGRADKQVKVRGYRIEPGEVEAALLRHGPVKDVAVAAKEGPGGETDLVAYLAGDAPVDVAALRAYAARVLPAFMVPAYFIQVPAFPVTTNGKIDLEALLQRECTPGGGPSGYAAPRTPLETQLAAIWQQVLGVPQVGTEDNFFELGGHSIKAIRVIARVHRELGVSLALESLFRAPTVKALAGHIAESQQSEYEEITALPEQPFYEASPAQRRLWVADQLEKNQVAYNLVAAYMLEDQLDGVAFDEAFGLLLARHEVLRTVFVTVDGEPKQKINPAGQPRVPCVDLRDAPNPEETARALAGEAAMQPFALATGPLIRARLFRTGQHHCVVLVVVHHIVSDGRSLEITMGELLALYQARRQGAETPLPPPLLQYKAFAAWQHRQLAGGRLNAHRQYWLSHLASALPAANLPADLPRPQRWTSAGDSHNVAVPATLADGLKELGRQCDTTLYVAFSAAFQALLYRYTGQETFLTGTGVGGRYTDEIDQAVGLFANTLVLKADLRPEMSFRGWLARTHREVVGAVTHQAYPFVLLVEDLDVRHEAGRSALVECGFTWEEEEAPRQSAGYPLERFEVDMPVAKYDLWLYGVENAGSITLRFEYRTDVFRRATIEQFANRFMALLAEVVRTPDVLIGDLNLAEAEQASDALQWNTFSDLNL